MWLSPDGTVHQMGSQSSSAQTIDKVGMVRALELEAVLCVPDYSWWTSWLQQTTTPNSVGNPAAAGPVRVLAVDEGRPAGLCSSSNVAQHVIEVLKTRVKQSWRGIGWSITAPQKIALSWCMGFE